MALLFWNKTTLKNQAIIWLEDSDDSNSKIEFHSGYTIIKNEDRVLGINIENASSIFNFKEGPQSISIEMVNSIKKKIGIDLSQYDLDTRFVVGKILERKNHPKSDKLFLLKIQAHKEIEIVTNTLNSIVGNNIVLAKVGAMLPSGVVVGWNKVMGIKSEGMLCGASTLKLKNTPGAHIVNELNVGTEFTL